VSYVSGGYCICQATETLCHTAICSTGQAWAVLISELDHAGLC
jgi:hypothetical protein